MRFVQIQCVTLTERNTSRWRAPSTQREPMLASIDAFTGTISPESAGTGDHV